MALPLTPRSTGNFITAPVWNAEIVDNINALNAGAMAITGQAAGDDIYAASATQLARGNRQLRESFSGLVSRTHPDADKAAYQCLASCERAVMSDGAEVTGWSNILFDITASGAGGLDTDTEQASTWYQKYLIRKSSDGTKAGLLHRAKDYFLDESNTTIASQSNLRDGAGQTKRAQTFDTDVTGPCEKIEWKIGRVGAVTGRVWVSIYATAAGLPTGAALKTSDKIDASAISASLTQAIVFPFRDPATLTAGTTYAAVLEGDFAISGAAYLVFDRSTTDPYAAGQLCAFDGASWSGSAVDAWFKVYVTQNDTTLTLPTGYDQYCRIGWVYNNSGSNFSEFSARNRVVTFPNTGSNVVVVGSSATVGTLIDVSPIYPPAPCIPHRWYMEADAAGRVVRMGMTPDASAFGTYWQVPTSQLNIYVDQAMPIEFQYLYFKTTGGTAGIYGLGYQW